MSADPRDEFLPGFAPDPEAAGHVTLPEGIHLDVSHEDYHADPGVVPSLSSGIARLLVDESPADAYCEHPRLGGIRRPGSRAMDRGTMIHLLLLGKGQTFHEIEADDYRGKSAQIAKKHAIDDGLVPVLSRELEEYQRVVKIFRDKLANHEDHEGKPDPIILDGQSEVTGIWQDDGVLCRLRADHWKERDADAFDVKTTDKSVAPAKILRAMYSFGTDVQHAHYVRGLGKLSNAVGRVRMRFIFVQVRPPYGVVVIEPAGTLRELGERRLRRGRDRWRACLEDHLSDDAKIRAGAWPGHGENRTIRLPAEAWMLKADEDAEVLGMSPGDPPDF